MELKAHVMHENYDYVVMTTNLLPHKRLRRDFDDDGNFFLDNLRGLVGAVVSPASVEFKFPCIFVLFFSLQGCTST